MKRDEWILLGWSLMFASGMLVAMGWGMWGVFGWMVAHPLVLVPKHPEVIVTLQTPPPPPRIPKMVSKKVELPKPKPKPKLAKTPTPSDPPKTRTPAPKHIKTSVQRATIRSQVHTLKTPPKNNAPETMIASSRTPVKLSSLFGSVAPLRTKEKKAQEISSLPRTSFHGHFLALGLQAKVIEEGESDVVDRRYLEKVKKLIHRRFNPPTPNVHAKIQLLISPKGKLLEYHIVARSHDEAFDREIEELGERLKEEHFPSYGTMVMIELTLRSKE